MSSHYLDCVYPEPALDVLQGMLAACYAAYVQHTIATSALRTTDVIKHIDSQTGEVWYQAADREQVEVEREDTDPMGDESFEREQNI